MAATKALFLLGLIALFAVATARSDDSVAPAGSRALLTGKHGVKFDLGHKFDFDFESWGHKKYIQYKKYYEKDDEEDEDDECHDCDDKDDDECEDKKYYKHCYYRHNHKKCDCKKEHKKVYYVVKYKKSECH